MKYIRRGYSRRDDVSTRRSGGDEVTRKGAERMRLIFGLESGRQNQAVKTKENHAPGLTATSLRRGGAALGWLASDFRRPGCFPMQVHAAGPRSRPPFRRPKGRGLVDTRGAATP